MTMGGANTNNKTILITVANEASGHINAASGGGPTGGTSSSSGKNKKEEKQKDTSLKKLIGIDISLAAMLKQSQIFTGFLGSVFQLVGMLVDVVLAPLAPYLFRLVEIVASWIPKIARGMELAVQWAKDGLDKLAEISTTLTGIQTSAGDLVESGWKYITLSGFGALIGSSFAAKLGNLADWNLKDFFKGVVTTDDVLDPLKAEMLEGGKARTAFKALMKLIGVDFALGVTTKLATIAKTGIKVLGIGALALSIVISAAQFREAWDNGDVGGAITQLVIDILVLAVPLLVGLFFGGWAAIASAIVLTSLALWYEHAVPDETKSSIEAAVADFYKEMNDTMNEWFGDRNENGFRYWLMKLSLFFGGQWNPQMWQGILTKEDKKQKINESIRNLLDDMINGLIDLINSLIESVVKPFSESWAGKAIRGNPLLNRGGWLDNMGANLIPNVDFSQITPVMGSSTPAVYDEMRATENPGLFQQGFQTIAG